jgi:methylthioribose-1-phosphate isomerase
VVERELRTLDDVVDAIRTLAVRGAPAIGIAGAMGLVAALADCVSLPRREFIARATTAAAAIRATRPTAVNLPWALDRMLRRLSETSADAPELLAALHDEATAILEEDRRMCREIGEHGVSLLHDGARVLTHCNAGALATGGIGTALAPLYVAAERGMRLEVFVDETRPMLQGSRLTAWELRRAGIATTILADAMAAALMRDTQIDLCIVGADRIAANGDVANKIGTYGLAIVARHHDVPFYVAAPTSTIDPGTPSGREIPIEQRAPDELLRLAEVQTAPPDACVYNPAFDVTPSSLVTGIITESGVSFAPYAFTAR